MTADGAIASGALALLPERGVWSPAARTLFVADLHLGKASAFRAAGAPAPFGTSEESLQAPRRARRFAWAPSGS